MDEKDALQSISFRDKYIYMCDSILVVDGLIHSTRRPDIQLCVVEVRVEGELGTREPEVLHCPDHWSVVLCIGWFFWQVERTTLPQSNVATTPFKFHGCRPQYLLPEQHRANICHMRVLLPPTSPSAQPLPKGENYIPNPHQIHIGPIFKGNQGPHNEHLVSHIGSGGIIGPNCHLILDCADFKVCPPPLPLILFFGLVYFSVKPNLIFWKIINLN